MLGGGEGLLSLVILYSGFGDEWILAKDLMKTTFVACWCSPLLFLLVSFFPFAACLGRNLECF